MLTGLAQAKIDAASRATEHYLGVLVKDAPYELAPGQNAGVMFVLMYRPDESYDDVVPGATFTNARRATDCRLRAYNFGQRRLMPASLRRCRRKLAGATQAAIIE